MNTPRFEPVKEYETLRHELIQGKRYVFERPILIITAIIALVKFENTYAIYLPVVLIGFLFFNLWFTVNRLGSMARITAYIQVVLEDDQSMWVGWETALRHNRKWLRLKKKSVNEIPIEDSATYDKLSYFRTIYFMHVIVTMMVFMILAIFTAYHFEWNNIAATAVTLVLLILFIAYAIKNKPTHIKQQIEKHRKNWIDVFEDLKKNGQ